MKEISGNLVRLIVVIVLQVWVFKETVFFLWGMPLVRILLLPLFLMLLPYKRSNTLLLLIAFLAGLILDYFNESLGLHTSAAVATMFIRPFLLEYIKPRGGYGINTFLSHSDMGLPWTIRYVASFSLIYALLFAIFSYFQWSQIGWILATALLSGVASTLVIMALLLIFNPKS